MKIKLEGESEMKDSKSQKSNMINKTLKITVFLATLLLFIALGRTEAVVSFGVNFNFGAPPQEMVYVPGNVYYVPDPDVDVFFYDQYWWTIRNNHWYRTRNYNGSWVMIGSNYVPSPVFKVYRVPNYKKYYEKKGGKRVSYEKVRGQGKNRGSNKEKK